MFIIFFSVKFEQPQFFLKPPGSKKTSQRGPVTKVLSLHRWNNELKDHQESDHPLGTARAVKADGKDVESFGDGFGKLRCYKKKEHVFIIYRIQE